MSVNVCNYHENVGKLKHFSLFLFQQSSAECYFGLNFDQCCGLQKILVEHAFAWAIDIICDLSVNSVMRAFSIR